MMGLTLKRGSLLAVFLSRGIFSLVKYCGFAPTLFLEAGDLHPNRHFLQQIFFFPHLGIWLLILTFSLGGGK
jgi:hypothetical protein